MARSTLLRPAARAGLLVLVTLLVGTGCSPLDDALSGIFGRSMRDQRSFDPYENTLLPPENSVAFSAGNYTLAPGQVTLGQPAVGAAALVPRPFTQVELKSEYVVGLVNPVPPSPASLARGEQLYDRFCVPCHSAEGLGANAPLAPVHPVVTVFDVSGANAAGYSDGYIYGLIRVGRGVMPAYGHRVTHFDRWNIVNYVHQLQVEAGSRPATAADGSSGAGAGR